MMGWFKKEIIDAASAEIGDLPGNFANHQHPVDVEVTAVSRPVVRKEVYSVRVRKGFKQDIVALRAQLIGERQALGLSAKMTEGEVLDLMLGLFRSARSGSPCMSRAVPLSEDVWQGVSALSKRLQIPPSDVIERLVVQKADELGLFSRRR